MFQKLFDKINSTVEDKTADKLVLKNGTRVLALPSFKCITRSGKSKVYLLGLGSSFQYYS